MSDEKKRNVYFAQVAYKNGRSAYLPYAVGVLIAYAWKDDRIRENYSVADIFFLRDDIDKVVEKLDDPVYFGFSSYLWNMEYNKALAKKVKEKYPDCVIQFGGHQVHPDSSLLHECDYIDILVHNEGEEPVRQILLELLNGTARSFENIYNISYRKNGQVINNERRIIEMEDYPSPYLEGVFADIMVRHPELEFIPVLETNRGCPNRCSYCGWGMYKSKIRLFPMERIYRELEWVAEHQIEFLGFADANFGLFERDETIVDWIVSFKENYGYPKKFQVSYAKNSSKRIFEMTKKLNDNRLDKGVTLAFQSLSQEVLDYIGRSNIKLSYYEDLLKRYTNAGIATYSELIMGLPGETYESFAAGVNTLLKAGQHNSLFIHMLEWLPCSEMGDPAYMKKHGIKYVTMPLSQPHRRKSEIAKDIQEYSRIVVETNSMTSEDWIKMNLFSVCVLSFHYLGILEYFAIYFFFEKQIEYKDFYQELLGFLLADKTTVCGKVFGEIETQLHNIIENHAAAICVNEAVYDDICWTLEEYAFLELVRHKTQVYEELRPFLEKFGMEQTVFDNLFLYQKAMLKTINQPRYCFAVDYNFPAYFKNLLVSTRRPLKAQRIHIEINDPNTCKDWKDYARYVVWYGRREGKNLYTEEMKYRAAEQS